MDDDLLIMDNSMEAPNSSVNSSNSNSDSDSDSESEPECNGTPEFWDIEEQEVNVDLQPHDNVKSDSTQFVALRILKWTCCCGDHFMEYLLLHSTIFYSFYSICCLCWCPTHLLLLL